MELSRIKRFAKVTGIYRWSEGTRFDFAYYASEHARLSVETLAPFGLLRFECDRMVGIEPPTAGGVIAVSNAYFGSIGDAQYAITKAGSVLAADITNYTDILPILHISEALILEAR